MGDLNCYNKVGDMLYYGWGSPVDHEGAVRYYRLGEQAPVRGQRYALRKAKEALGRCYENGHGVEKDLEMAAQKYLEGYRYGSQECKAGYLRCKSLTEAQEK
jgi:TPR repeat protein